MQDTDVSTIVRKPAAAFRGEHIGFIFQDFNLVPVLTICATVESPSLMEQNRPANERREQVEGSLEAEGVAELVDKRQIALVSPMTKWGTG